MSEGTISEQGAYQELITRQGPFSDFVRDFGGGGGAGGDDRAESDENTEVDVTEEAGKPLETDEKQELANEEQGEELPQQQSKGGAFMQQEERSFGAVSAAGLSLQSRWHVAES